MKTLTVRTERQSQLVDVTRLVQDAVAGEPGSAVLVYVPHTTAGVTINEHADPMVARDFEAALERIVPADWPWRHVEEGEENAPTHIRASFMGQHVLVRAHGQCTSPFSCKPPCGHASSGRLDRERCQTRCLVKTEVVPMVCRFILRRTAKPSRLPRSVRQTVPSS